MTHVYQSAAPSIELGLGGWLEYQGLLLNYREPVVTDGLLNTNYAPNPKAQNNTAELAGSWSSTMVSPSFQRVSCNWASEANWCFQIAGTVPSSPPASYFTRLTFFDIDTAGVSPLPVQEGEQITISLYVNVPQPSDGGGISYEVNWYDSENVEVDFEQWSGLSDESLDGDRMTRTFTVPAGAVNMSWSMTHGSNVANDVLVAQVTKIQVERNPSASDYFDGDSLNAIWNGSANNSISSLYTVVGVGADFYRILEIDGLGDPDIRDSREVNPSAHGETAFQSWYGGRTITITGRIEAGNLAQLRKMTDDLKTAFGSLDENFLYFRNTHPEFDAKISCRKNAPINIKEVQSGWDFRRDFQISLRASHPFFLSGQDLVAEQSFDEVVELGFFFDMDFDLVFSEYMSSDGEPIPNANPFSIENVGNFSTYPVIRIHGPVSTPSVINVANGQVINLDTTIDSDDYYEIDTSKRTVIDSFGTNRFAQITSDSDWMVLESGSNLILIGGTSTDSNSRVEIIYNHTWI